MHYSFYRDVGTSPFLAELYSSHTGQYTFNNRCNIRDRCFIYLVQAFSKISDLSRGTTTSGRCFNTMRLMKLLSLFSWSNLFLTGLLVCPLVLSCCSRSINTKKRSSCGQGELHLRFWQGKAGNYEGISTRLEWKHWEKRSDKKQKSFL